MRTISRWIGYTALTSAAALAASPAAVADDIKDLITEADISLDLRYRFAFIDQANFGENARASTLQSLLGIETGEVAGFSGYVQVRNVTVIGAERFNSTINGLTQFPVEADPEATEFDQAYVSFTGIPGTRITAGRRKFDYGNQRFVSKLGWRQNQRSYDGVALESQLTDELDIKYSYTFNVNRAFTDESPIGNFDGNFHLANASYTVAGLGVVTGYGYWLDFNDDFALSLSSRSFGANLTGSQQITDTVSFSYVLEAAQQNDFADNPFDFSVQYVRAEPTLKVDTLSLSLGYELLGGDGVRAFTTPLALLHAYNGFADQFLVTPVDGLQDFYATARYRFTDGALEGTNVLVSYHEFRSDVNNLNYGSEWDAVITKKIGPINFLGKLAVFNADEFNVNVTRFWLQMATSF